MIIPARKSQTYFLIKAPVCLKILTNKLSIQIIIQQNSIYISNPITF
jgi:hypothetical protein